MKPLETLDLGVLVLYLLGIFLFGCSFVRKSTRSDRFTTAGRALPGWVVGFSILGTYVSSISFLANPGKTYAANWNPFLFSLAMPLAAIFAIRYFVPFYRHGGHVSAYQQIEERFGLWARSYLSLSFVAMHLARTGIILYLMALAMHSLLGWSLDSIILLTGCLVIVYTLLGGIEAVIWTDLIQSLVLISGAVICLAVLLNGIPGGVMEVWRAGAAQGKFSLGALTFSADAPNLWSMLLFGFLINLRGLGVSQDYIQRYLSARSDRDARQSVWLVAIAFPLVSAAFFFIGTALFVYYQHSPQLLTPGLSGDQIFPFFIVAALPAGLTGLLLAAIMAAAMSSIDSSINSSATLVLEDGYKRYWRPQPSEKTAMGVLYVATLVLGICGTGLALWMAALNEQEARSTLDVWWTFEGIFSGGMLGLFLLGVLSRRANTRAAMISVSLGVVVIAWLLLSRRYGSQFPATLQVSIDKHLDAAITTACILVCGFTLAALSRSFRRHSDA